MSTAQLIQRALFLPSRAADREGRAEAADDASPAADPA
jgi:hypothetical protein